MPTEIINYSQMVEKNGKTVRENNMEQKHKYPVGTRVWSTFIGESGVIESQGRDCDGSVLYSVAFTYNLGEDDLKTLREHITGGTPEGEAELDALIARVKGTP